MVKRRFVDWAGITLVLAGCMPWHAAHAQSYPAKPVQLPRLSVAVLGATGRARLWFGAH
jgi:hypothetical protein